MPLIFCKVMYAFSAYYLRDNRATSLMESTTVVETGDTACGPAPAIKPINTGTVHKICSGQVVLSLAMAVKELVENSLDAGSTSIEIRLKEHGLESVQVVDNGCGVEEDNFQALTLSHHTSKLNDFEDLVNVDTFGFRGEALSSLCCLGNLVVVTCHKSSSVGTKLEFNHKGKLVKQSPCSRQVGTTVTVQNLFSTLPVRRKEFTKNVKKEFAKMLQVLYAYCLIATGTRIICTNQVGKRKSIVVTTQSQVSLKDNICSVFGHKQITSLLPFEQQPISPAVLDEYSLKESALKSNIFCISGFVSSCQHGLGRSSCDRQFFYINGRPCDLSKLSKVVNNVYHSYNRHQQPFIMLDVKLSRESVDINVTPDKRLMFFENETILLAIVKSSLVAMYEPLGAIVQAVVPKQNGVTDSQRDHCRDFNSLASSPSSPVLNLKRSFSFIRNSDSSSEQSDLVTSPAGSKQPRVDSYFLKTSPKSTGKPAGDLRARTTEKCSSANSNLNTALASTVKTVGCQVKFTQIKDSSMKLEQSNKTAFVTDSTPPEFSESRPSSMETHVRRDEDDVEFLASYANGAEQSSESDHVEDSSQEEEYELDGACNSNAKSVTLLFSMDTLRAQLKKTNESLTKPIVRKFRAKIEAGENMAAEEELKKEISKDSFAKMDIIGQFNLGFIIAKLEADLFIVDQHATDEKYNFETLQKNTVLDTQQLIRPLSLGLTAMNETVLLDNLETFRKNGFSFEIDEEAEPCKRIKLVATPVSGNWAFGKEDIEEMLFMLSDAAPGVMCRPSRIQEMFASRACRMSVKIGTALSSAKMKRLVLHMGEMDQPWNCPHQRPTIRHLVNLDMVGI